VKRWKDGRFKPGASHPKQESIMRFEFFWVPESRRVEIPTEPKVVQTVLPHRQHDSETGALIRVVNSRDPDVVPVLRILATGETYMHNYEVFYEDHIHDWHWKDGVLRYFSRAIHEGKVWIRVEFKD
jgi:hypothetical protein